MSKLKIHRNQTGLTSVKIFILIGLLAVIFYISYSVIKDRRIKGLVVYASLYARNIETEMNEYFEDHGKFPPDLKTAGIPDIQKPIWWDTGKKLTYRITLDRDSMTFEFIDAPSAILKKTLIFKSSVSGDQLSWICVGSTIKAKYQPSECKD